MKVEIIGSNEGKLAEENDLHDALKRCFAEYYWLEDNHKVYFHLVIEGQKYKLTVSDIGEMIGSQDLKSELEEV